ncbi:MAG TPA: hypothetical protein VFH56_06565 [Acidimicrobiales bacterium]|nr:hypothetical protein [Acidimicrobiales bacterium]
MTNWQAKGAADLEKLAVAYREGGRKIRSRTARRLREAAMPLAEDVVKKGAEPMPHTGGLRDRLLAAKPGVTVSLLGKRTAVSIRVKNADADRIRAINRTGDVRHPVFGRRKGKGSWSSTSVPANTWTDAFAEGAPVVRRATAMAVQEALAEIAREASNT